jgi:hypothetical protein
MFDPTLIPAHDIDSRLLTKCIQSENGYEIHRVLLAEEIGKPELNLMYVIEWISQDGEYILKQQSILPTDAGLGIRWYLPIED